MAHFFVITNALNGSLIYYHSHIEKMLNDLLGQKVAELANASKYERMEL